MGVKLKQFLSDLHDCLGWPYRSPGVTSKDASSGIDCSGMLVRAYKLQGGNIYHGSNTIWRKGYLTEKGRLTSVSQLKPGYAVFKHTNVDTNKYQDGLGNFHHIGVVESVNPLKIIHASSAKGQVVEDESIKGWSHWGKLKAVDYDETQTTVSASSESVSDGKTYATVKAQTGSTVNMRTRPIKYAGLMARVPIGDTVEITGKMEEKFYPVKWGRWTGYMMAEYLEVRNNG